LGHGVARGRPPEGQQGGDREGHRVGDRATPAFLTGSIEPLPRWLTVTFAASAGVVSLGAATGIVIAVINAYAGSRVQDSALLGRLATVERDVTGLPGRVQQIENGVETARRIRDQQQQGISDRLRALELSDQTGSERLAQLAQTIASILPRLEEILRRQERLENRLGAAAPRPGLGEAPASYGVPETLSHI
jgi:hypothetical protein